MLSNKNVLCLTYTSISSHLILVSAHNGDEPPKDIHGVSRRKVSIL